MLVELRIQNLLLMERAELVLDSGLNVITGETGAGKTMLAHALDLLLGGKPKRGLARPGASEAYVEGVFELTDGIAGHDLLEQRARDGLIDPDCRELVIARRVTAQGRSRAYMDGKSVNAKDLQTVGGELLSFFGQHEHRKLTLASAQLDILDGFCGPEQLELRDQYRNTWRSLGRLEAELAELAERAGARERDLDLLEFELAEIEQAAPTEDELEGLERDRERLDAVEGLREAAATALDALGAGSDDGGAADRIAAAGVSMRSMAASDEQLGALADRGEALAVEVRELAAELTVYEQSLESDPARLDAVRERLDLLGRLQRKHGGTIAAVLEHAERCRSERDRLANASDETKRLEAELAKARERAVEIAARLSDGRNRAGAELEAAVRDELADLAMSDADFSVRLVRPGGGSGGELTTNGAETTEFSIAPNPGVPAGPLREIASGGELSRVMLALMAVSTGSSGSEVVVFDEVDAGVGGKTANAIAARLGSLATTRQVICITHLPQIASAADRHFSVTKTTGGAKSDPEAIASTSVERLEGEAVVSELCRMLGSDAEDGAARRHAESLLQAA